MEVDSINKNRKIKRKGFTLIEIVVALGLFFIIGYSVYLAYANILDAIVANQIRSDAVSLIKNKIEIIRNMPFSDVGINGGYPVGKLPAEETVSWQGNNFLVKTTVRNADDPFDGTATSTPRDNSPADYKFVQFEVLCQTCAIPVNLDMETIVSPRSLEGASNNGSLFISVFDSRGVPVPGADIRVVNTDLNPDITITDVSNNEGLLQLVDLPPSSSGYEITVTKAGYSTDKTYDLDLPGNPNPLKPYATISSQQVTAISFFIDKVSTLNVSAIDISCQPVADFPFGLSGAKLIGTSPDTFKYPETTFNTGSSGQKTINNLEWDTYNLRSLSAGSEFTAMSPIPPFIIDPDSVFNASMFVESKIPSSLLISVVGAGGEPINDARVEITRSGFSSARYSGRKTREQTDWSGAGEYTGKSEDVKLDNPTGEISVQKSTGATSTEWLESKTFDLGTQDTAFYDLSWDAHIEPIHSSEGSFKIQIASNNDNATWNYIGPDGTENSYYEISGTPLNSIHSGKRYLRYKVFFKFDGATLVLSIKDIFIDFRSGCIPAGQALFDDLNQGIYTVSITKSGYQNFSDTIDLNSDWQTYKATLTAQ